MLRDAKISLSLEKIETDLTEDSEIKTLYKQDTTQFMDIDIDKNTKDVIKFTKRPWSEWICGTFCIGFPIISLILIPANWFVGIR